MCVGVCVCVCVLCTDALIGLVVGELHLLNTSLLIIKECLLYETSYVVM